MGRSTGQTDMLKLEEILDALWMEEIRHQLIGGLSCDKPIILPLFTVFHKDQEFPCLVQDFATIHSRFDLEAL